VAHRIVVVGVSGNGKTTLSRRLAAQLGVPYVELDALNRAPALAA
jgi:adenylate kinase family enzyme